MGMYDAAQRKLGQGTEHREEKPPKGPGTEKGPSGEQEEPGKVGGEGVAAKRIHARLAGHHTARAAYHERLSKLHAEQSAHHSEEAAFHEGAAGEY